MKNLYRISKKKFNAFGNNIWRTSFFIGIAIIVYIIVKKILHNKIIGIVDHPGLQGEILFQKNIIYNFERGNLFRYFITDYINYPFGENLGFTIANSFHLFLYLPLKFIFGIIESYNALVIIVFLLNLFSAYLLARYLFPLKAVALYSALVFTLNSYVLLKINMGFVQKYVLFWIPLYCLFLFKLRDAKDWRYALGAGFVLCLMQFTYPPYSYYAIFFTAALLIYSLFERKELYFAFSRFIFIVILLIGVTSLIYYFMGLGFVYFGMWKPKQNIMLDGCLDLFRPFRFFPYHFSDYPTGLPLGISFSAFLLGIIAILKKRGLPRLLFFNFIFFVIIAAGPYLSHEGSLVKIFNHKVVLPFYFMSKYLPFAGGIFFPIRVFPFINICLALLAGYGLLYFSSVVKKMKFVYVLFFFVATYLLEQIIFFSELFPPKISTVRIPRFCQAIKDENFAAILNFPITAMSRRIINRYGYYSALSGKKMVNSYFFDKPSIYFPNNSDNEAVKKEFITELSQWNVGYIVIHKAFLKAEYGDISSLDAFSWLSSFCESTLFYPEDNLLVYKIKLINRKHNFIYIPKDFTSMQKGIKEAKDGDILLVAPGRYKENINFMGKAIHIKSVSGPEVTVIDGSKSKKGPVVIFNSGEDARSILEGFMICNGSGIMLPADDRTKSFKSNGGGIICINSSPQIIGNVIENNDAENGGGICCLEGSLPLIANNIIRNNFATKGAGVRCSMQSSPQIVDNKIVDNKALRLGGGIYWRVGSYPVIKNNIILSNYAGEKGGGLFGSSYVTDTVKNTDVLVSDCIIRKNISPIGPSMALGSSVTKVKVDHCNIEGGKNSIDDPEGILIWSDNNFDSEDMEGVHK